MKPFTSAERQAIIDDHPAAAPSEIEADIDEYQSLVAERMSRDPSLPAVQPAPPAAAALESREPDPGRDPELRLRFLHAKLFREP